MPSREQEFFSIKELGQLFGVSKQTVNKWLQAGEMQFLRREMTIRVPRSEVEKFISRNLADIAAKASA
jgi:excisionase family DNA binding protein